MNTNEPMTQEQLDAIRERADKSTAFQLQLAVPGDTQRIALYHSDDVDALITEVERLRALTKDMARAWEEGYRARGADAIYIGLTGDPSDTPNPYEQDQS